MVKNMESQESGAIIGENHLKDLHLLYETTLNRKKQFMYDYEKTSKNTHNVGQSVNCLRTFISNACCCLNKLLPTLKYVKKHTTR